MARPPATGLLLAALLAGCAGAGRGLRPVDPETAGERIAARAAALVGHGQGFEVDGARFAPDCIGFVEAVYQAEGLPLRAAMIRVAPRETSGVAAAFALVERDGAVFGGGGEWPRPGDLVFWHDTWDRDGNGRADDPLTHVGIVEQVASGTGTVTFLHRAGRAVERGFMTLDQPDRWRAADGTVLNTPLRTKGKGPRPDVPVLAGELFGGYGHLDPRRLLEEAGVR